MDNAELERRIRDLEERVSKLESDDKSSTKSTQAISSDFEEKLVEVIDDIGTQDLIIISLRLKGPQTKEMIRKTLDDWGKTYGSWFNGGNFNARLIDKGVVKVDSTIDSGESVYALTKKGEKAADKIMEEIKKMDD